MKLSVSFQLRGYPRSVSLVADVNVFTRAGGHNVRCFGGKTLRGSRNLIMRMLRRVIVTACFIYGITIGSADDFPEKQVLVDESASEEQRACDSSRDIEYICTM